MVEKHSTAFVESLEADPVLLVHVLLFHRDIVGFVIPDTEPLRLTGLDGKVLVPLPETELFDVREAILVVRVLGRTLIVDVRKEDRGIIVLLDVPPSPVVISRGYPLLQDHLVGQIAEHAVHNRTVPLSADGKGADTLMGRAEGEQGVDTEAWACLDHGTGNEASL